MNPFGQNNYSSGGYTKRNRYKLKDGDNVYRILPAMGDLASDGIWSVYYNVVFGFKTSDGKHQPFQSPLVEKTTTVDGKKVKTITIPCAATALVRKLKDQMEQAKEAGNTTQASQLAKLVGDFPVMGVYSLNNDHYLNVVDRQGNVGQLKLGHKAMQALKTEIDRIRKEEGFDPLSPDNGRFFNIRRSGKGRDTVNNVTVVKGKIEAVVNGVTKLVDEDVVHSIDDTLLNRLLETRKDGTWKYKEAADLTKLFKSPTSEEVELIVKNADIMTGKSTGIDQVFPKHSNQVNSSEENSQESQQTPPTLGVVQGSPGTGSGAGLANTLNANQAAPGLANATASAGPATPINNAPTVAQETKAAVKKASEAPAPTATKTTAEAVAAMSPDDFMKLMNLNA